MGPNKNRGLSTLMGDVGEVYSRELGLDKNRVSLVEISKITPNPFQPRETSDEAALNELASSIKEHGLIQPIIVLKKNNSFILVANERRLRATQILGKENILAFVSDSDESRLRELALIENIQRENLDPIELANSYKDLIEAYNITQENSAELIYKSRTQIANTLRLSNLDPKTQDLTVSGKISQGHAKVLVGLDKEDEKVLVDSILGQELDVRDTERLVQKVKNKENTEDVEFENSMRSLEQTLNKLGFASKNNKKELVIRLDNIEKIKELTEILNKF